MLERADATAEIYNELCGDFLRIDLKMHDRSGKYDKQRVADVAFSGEGCAISIASASILTQSIKGKTVAELLTISPDDIVNMLNTILTPIRLKCAFLSWEVLKKALRSYQQEGTNDHD